MPEAEYHWLPRADLLSFEETAMLVDAFLAAGVRKLRITGGEPLLRRDLPVLVRLLSGKTAVRDVALTTNGILLAQCAGELRANGLDRINVSIDTLQRERFESLTRRDQIDEVFRGMEAARSAGFPPLKLDTVVIRGFNEDEIVPLLEFAREMGAELRFIEYMDVGGATDWSPEKVYSRREILDTVRDAFGRLLPVSKEPSAPADRFRLPDGTVFGVISSTTEPFCGSCDRSRLTADGMWYLCLYARSGWNLRDLLREGATLTEIRERIASVWSQRTDRGAWERLQHPDRRALAPAEELRSDPHLEMHTRGG